MKQEYLIAYMSMASVLLPLSVALAHRKMLPAELKPLLLILVIAMLCDGLAFFLVKYAINTHWIGNIYLISQFFLLVWMFREQLNRKKWVNLILIFFVVFFLVNIIFFQGPLTFNSVSNVMACLILMPLCMYYFYRLLNDLPTTDIHSLPMLWISFAVLIYYAGNFFLFLVSNYFIKGEEQSHRMLWNLHNLLNITKNILFAVALWQSYRKVRSSLLSSQAP